MPGVNDGQVEVGDRRIDFCVYNIGSPRRAVFEYGIVDIIDDVSVVLGVVN